MHGEVDHSRQEGFLDFLGEKPLAAGCSERPVLDRVAGSADHLDLDPVVVEARHRGEAQFHLPRLRQRQRRAARADAQDGWFSPGLGHVTSGDIQMPGAHALRYLAATTKLIIHPW